MLIEGRGIDDFYDVLNTETRGKNGTVFTFVGLHHNISNIKSMHNVKKFWGEEAQTFSQNSLQILFPTIRAEGSELIFTMNPILEEDPAYQMLVVNPPPDSLVVKVNYSDNPYFPEVLRKEMEHLKVKNYQEYLHVWEGNCKAAVEGAIFAKELSLAQEQGRILHVPYNEARPVDTFWDLGHSDQTAIWFAQIVGFEYRILRYYSNSQEKMQHYIKYLQSLPYTYGTHYLPHDAANEQLGQEKTIEQQARGSLGRVFVIPRVPHKVNSIEAARSVFGNCYFDKELCADGLSCLRRYAYRVDPETGKISKEPEHNIWSHGADAFQCLGMALKPEAPRKPKKPRAQAGWMRSVGI